MKKIFFLLLLLTFCVLTGQGLHYLKAGFSPRRIHLLPYPAAENFDTETAAALSRPFRYIGRGRQCFAFASDDDQYVLKIPRTDIYKTPFWVRVLPVASYRKRLEFNHLQKQTQVLESFLIAREELQEQTGVVVLHLGHSLSEQKITLIDSLGCRHHLPLGKTPFILQRKYPMLTKTFLAALQQSKRDEAERILDAWLQIMLETGQKGIANRDPSFLRNYGFDGKRAHQIDIGTFYHRKDAEKSVRDSMRPIQEWLAKVDPEMLAHLNGRLQSQFAHDSP